MKKAFITGITGQDGSYIAELLLSKGYEVHGMMRRASTFNTVRIDHIPTYPQQPDARFFLHYGDLTDSEQISNILYNVKPDEIYHLGAQSHVGTSFEIPEHTGNVTGLSSVRILEAMKRSGSHARFYQATSGEMFGDSPPPQSETTPLNPPSPYAVAKVYAYFITKNYRSAYNMFASNGILMNHESPRRAKGFVTRKITLAIAKILAKKQEFLYLGNLKPKRDWGFSPEYVEIIWRILQLKEPDDFVLGTGEQHTVQEFVEEAFNYVGLNWEKYVKISQKLFRPTELFDLVTDPSKIRKAVGWEPKVKFRDVIRVMIDADMRKIGLEPIGEGDELLKRKFPERWWKAD